MNQPLKPYPKVARRGSKPEVPLVTNIPPGWGDARPPQPPPPRRVSFFETWALVQFFSTILETLFGNKRDPDA